MSKTLITSGQRKQIVRFFEDGLDKLELADLAAQSVIERGGELQTGLRQLLIKLSTSDYGYRSGYARPKSVADQVERLTGLFPELRTFDESIAQRDLPDEAEGYFVLLPWQKIALTYGEAVQKVLSHIYQALNGKFYNNRQGNLGPGYLRQRACTVDRFGQLAQQQAGHDFLVVPCQFGLRHRGQSVLRAREVMTANEFGLDAFSVGIMLLIHPERLQDLNDLRIVCPGDEFSSDVGGDFSRVPCFRFSGGGVVFDALGVDNERCYNGSASGFLLS